MLKTQKVSYEETVLEITKRELKEVMSEVAGEVISQYADDGYEAFNYSFLAARLTTNLIKKLFTEKEENKESEETK